MNVICECKSNEFVKTNLTAPLCDNILADSLPNFILTASNSFNYPAPPAFMSPITIPRSAGTEGLVKKKTSFSAFCVIKKVSIAN